MEREKYTLQEKRTFKSYWTNFWYYHKFAFWFFLIAAICVFLSFNPFGDNTKADYTVGLITSKTWSEQHQQRLEKMLAAYADDRNGDGKIKIEVSYILQPEDSSVLEPAEFEAYRMKLFSTFEAGDVMIFLVDGYNLRFYGVGEQLFCRLDDYSTLPEDVDVEKFPLEDVGIPWKELNGVNQHAYFSRSTSKMYFCFRAIVPALKEESLERREAEFPMFQRLQNNTPADPELLAQVLADIEKEYAAAAASATGSK